MQMLKLELQFILKKTGLSDAELARLCSVSLSTFKVWYYQQRPVPLHAARTLRLLVRYPDLAELLLSSDKPIAVPKTFVPAVRPAHRPIGAKNQPKTRG